MVVNMNTPAFPDQYKDGMTLRDYFAAKAMQALIHVQVTTAQQMTAETAYEWADAMLKAREA
jgi:hypothetical protein